MACQTVYTINALTLLAAEKDRHYAQVLYRGNLLLADGVGAVWAIHRLTGKKAERVPGVDLILDLSRICAKEKQSVFLLGSGPGVAEKAAQKLRQVIPGISIAGSCAGFWEPDQDAEIVNRINHSGAGLLLVGLGQPRQEFFLDTYRNDLQVGVAMGVGGSFDVPPSACSNNPGRSAVAPVNAPLRNPNSSDSSSDSGMAPQFTATKVLLARSDKRCTLRATISLPTPVSPVIKTGESVGATRAANKKACRTPALSPTISPSLNSGNMPAGIQR